MKKLKYIHLKLETTDFTILKTKKYFITSFCKLYSIKFSSFPLKKKIKKIMLLRSPHIHKKTWRVYKEITYIEKFKFNINNPLHLTKLYTLFKTINVHCFLKFNYITN